MTKLSAMAKRARKLVLLEAYRREVPRVLKARGWTWPRLARESGVGRAVLFKWLDTERAVTYDGARMERVLAVLGIEVRA